jgi:hypothetical protein
LGSRLLLLLLDLSELRLRLSGLQCRLRLSHLRRSCLYGLRRCCCLRHCCRTTLLLWP